LKILCVYGLIRSVLEPISNVLIAAGQTRLLFRSNLAVSVVQLALLYPAMRWFGIEGVATLVTLCYGLQFFIYFPYMKQKYDLPYKAIWQSLQPAFVTGTALIVLMSVAQEYLEQSMLLFIAKVLFISVAYILLYGVITRWRIVAEMKAIIFGNRAE